MDLDTCSKAFRFFCYGIQQTDKTMSTDLGPHGQHFYFTNLVGEFQSTWLLQKYKMGRIMTLYVVGWSICLFCISACNNWSHLMALREWYRTDEHANRSLSWQPSQGFFSIVCNLMLYSIARHVTKVGGIDPWRCISRFLGGLTLLGAEVKWLNEDSARVIMNQMAEDTAGKKWPWVQFRECFKDPQVYFGFFNTMLLCIPNGGITAFSSLMYQTFGFDEWGSMLYGLPTNGKWCMFDMTVVFSLALFLGWNLSKLTNVPTLNNVAGKTKRTEGPALTLISYYVGNMIGYMYENRRRDKLAA
ncbi:major facilitator superfamily domain-containing protein [Aspergillus spectabilis]